MSKTKTKDVENTEVMTNNTTNTEQSGVTLLDFMAGVAFLGYAFNKFEDLFIPEGKTLGEVVAKESYAWAEAMVKAKSKN